MKKLGYLSCIMLALALILFQPLKMDAQSFKDKKAQATYQNAQKNLTAQDAEKEKEAKAQLDKAAVSNQKAAVERCSTDSYMEKLLGDPQQAAEYQARMNEVKSRIDMSRVSIPCDANNTYIVPVAVHFSPGYTCANTQCLIDATDAQIESMNDDFAALNADLSLFTTDIVGCGAPDVASDGACITFCVATQNHPAVSGIPDGQPAITIGAYNGGVGDGGTATNGEWPGILNIFVTVGGAGGVSDGIGGDWSGTGVTVTGGVFGGPNFTACSSGGTLDDGGGAGWDLGRTLTHEVGHYLGLWHVFQNSCANEPNTPFPVTDTPGQSTSSGGCPGTGSCAALDTGCGTGEFLQFNFMDYYDDPCLVMFSNEQAIGMNQYVAAGIADGSIRQDATDCNTTFTSLPACSLIANFEPFDGTTLDVCADTGGNIVFTDLSTNGPVSWAWTFVANGGLTISSASSTMQNPTINVTGGTTGTLDVTLQVCDAGATCETATQTITINVVTGAACPSDCNATSTDTGGTTGEYASGETETWTFCPLDPACQFIQIEFTSFNTENNGAGCYDGLTIHDGNSAASSTIDPPVGGTIWCWDTNDATPTGSGDLVANGIITSTDASGCLTLVFTSDGSVTRDGWEANLSCIDNGQCACTSDADCDDSNACTTDVCNASVCENTPIPNCCATDADCDDADACTIDVCNAGVCENNPDPACCTADADCDDTNACTTDTCNGDGTCSNVAIAGCCTSDADCDDGNACTVDVCAANVCTNTPDPSCNNCPTLNGVTVDATEVCGDATTQICIDIDLASTGGGGGAAITTYSGELDASSPTFNRPLGGTTCSLSGAGTDVFYDVLPFTVDATGNYTFAMTSFGDDGHAAIYCGSFDPLDPCATFVSGDDDGNGDADPLIDPVALTTGVDYFLVTTTFSNGAVGVFDWAISGDGNVISGSGGGTPTNIMVFWNAVISATLVSGGGPTDTEACYTFSTNNLCEPEVSSIFYEVMCTDDNSSIVFEEAQINIYPLPPADLSTLVTISDENTCDEPTVVVVAGCENTVTVVADAANPTFPVNAGDSGNAVYEVTFAHVGGPDCCTITGGGNDIIVDGGFESGAPGNGWTESSTEAFGVIDGTFSINGAFAAWMGAIAAGQTTVEQTVTIPATATAADLSFNIAAGACDCAGGDTFELTLNGTVIWSLCNPVAGQVEDETTICGGVPPEIVILVTS